jgi:gamma-glutamylcyclotransferase (GGCT)/AIG2-like uncharacterized protein YtfP
MNLFAYGTLMHREILQKVSGEAPVSQRATLHNFERRLVRNRIYPAIFPKSGASVDGIVYFDLSSYAFDRLDAFEGAPYIRTKVMLYGEEGTSLEAYTYIFPATCIDLLSDEDWSYEEMMIGDIWEEI